MFPHYIFGYGSLICPTSRAVTAPTLAGRPATPVRVHGVERIWSLPFGGLTFLGIRVRDKADCVGVVVPVNDDELAQFDRRELGYDRIPIDTKNVYDLHYENQEGDVPPRMDRNATIWVYVPQKDFQPVSDSAPICQSYVDIILRGCLTISTDFSRDFLLTTRGWHQHDFLHHHHHDDDDDDDAHRKEGCSESVHWIDDRHCPRYVRADKEYSQANSHHLDRMLELHRPEWKHRRRV